MKKLENRKLENFVGGIECGDMFRVISYLSVNNPKQLASLSGLDLECTIEQYGNKVTRTYHMP